MAGEWEVVTTRRATQVLSPTRVQEVEIIGVVTKPHGVYFERAIPWADWIQSPAGADFYAAAPAGNIEYLLTSGTAVAAAYVEDLDASGLVQGFMEFTVTIPTPSPAQSGPFETNVLIPMADVAVGNLSGPQGFPGIDAAVAALRATAGL
jgi:hypothetical protein